jgi:YD repeat-containing protein
MSLGYYSPVQSGATARYSGDISSWAWTQYGQPAKAYAFTYDGAHRLTAGQYYNNGSSTNALSEKSITYDGECIGIPRLDMHKIPIFKIFSTESIVFRNFFLLL